MHCEITCFKVHIAAGLNGAEAWDWYCDWRHLQARGAGFVKAVGTLRCYIKLRMIKKQEKTRSIAVEQGGLNGHNWEERE